MRAGENVRGSRCRCVCLNKTLQVSSFNGFSMVDAIDLSPNRWGAVVGDEGK